MNNDVKLQFDMTIAGLAGNPYGQKIFKEQVKSKVDESKRITVVFPNHIERISSSFVQGFFSEWINQHGIDWIVNNVALQAKDSELCDWIVKNLK